MSRIERALKASRSGNAKSRDQSGAPRGLASSGTYRALSSMIRGLIPTRLERRVLEHNKLLPAVEDRRAVTAYKMLRTRVLHRMRSNQWRTLLVTSAAPGDGKTLTACNLALSIAGDVNQSVMLVDLDLQRPTMASYFGINPAAGIGDYLLGNAGMEEIVHVPEGLDRIAIVPNREPVLNSSELLASPRMHEFVDWAKASTPSTIVVFDMPPVLVCDDVLAFSPNADAALVVASEGTTERNSLHDAMETLVECNLLGVVLNRSNEQGSASEYYY